MNIDSFITLTIFLKNYNVNNFVKLQEGNFKESQKNNLRNCGNFCRLRNTTFGH